MFRSSIFSSETLQLADRPRSGGRSALLLAIAFVAAAEIVARLALAPIGEYWRYWNRHAAMKFEAYRGWTRARTVPEVVIVGDSTAAEDIDPASMVDPRVRPPLTYNLGWPANFALAFRDCTLPLLRAEAAPRLVVASFAPTGFVDSPRVRRFEKAIITSPFCRQLRGEWGAADFFYLARLRSAVPFRDSWFTGRGLQAGPDDLGFIALEGSKPAVEGPAEGHQIAAPRFMALQELAQTGRDRGFELVVVVPPRLQPSKSRLRIERAYMGQLARWGVTLLDYRNPPFLSHQHFYDRNHLNRTGARLLSRRLASDLTTLSPKLLDARHDRPAVRDPSVTRHAEDRPGLLSAQPE